MIFRYFIALCFVLQMAVSPADAQISRPDPEIATGFQAAKAAVGQEFMMTTAHPLATEAGYKILARGGSAADAAIAAQLVLGLVEPQSSGLGGGAFVLYYDAKSKELKSYDARETAPYLASPYLFNGMEFDEARKGGRPVGVPGVPMLLEQLHERYGTVTWMELFEDALVLAREGFAITPRLAKMITAHKEHLPDYFSQKGMLKNPAYEETLKTFAFSGAKSFYTGEIAQHIIEAVQNYAENPGLLTVRDFKEYQVKSRDPVCGPYRAYIVCSMGEPSSGGLTILQILAMIERFKEPTWHEITEASRLAFADRARYMADPDFVNTPNMALLDPAYIAQRSALIAEDKLMGDVQAGQPPAWNGELYGEDGSIDRPGTSHITAIDKDGNVISMTSSIESAFGSYLMVDGFLLNNQLTDFAFTPTDEQNNPRANRVEGGKRPRSSMSPTIVFDQAGSPVLALGSAGGSRIIGYVLQSLIAVLDWNMDVQDALNMPHILARGKATEAEVGAQDLEALQALGHDIVRDDMNSGLTAITIKDGLIKGAADPRREGIAMGR